MTDLTRGRLVDGIVTCVTCEQVLDNGRCTNPLCPGYRPRTGECPNCAVTLASKVVAHADGCEYQDEVTDRLSECCRSLALEGTRRYATVDGVYGLVSGRCAACSKDAEFNG